MLRHNAGLHTANQQLISDSYAIPLARLTDDDRRPRETDKRHGVDWRQTAEKTLSPEFEIVGGEPSGLTWVQADLLLDNAAPPVRKRREHVNLIGLLRPPELRAGRVLRNRKDDVTPISGQVK